MEYGLNRSATRSELSRHVEIARTCLRQVSNEVCNEVCELDSVIEVGLYCLNTPESSPGNSGRGFFPEHFAVRSAGCRCDEYVQETAQPRALFFHSAGR